MAGLIDYDLEFSDGQHVRTSGHAIVGRNPSLDNLADQLDGATDATLVTLQDPKKALSRTHFAIGQYEDTLWVADLGSGNGTVLTYPNGSTHNLEPGVRYEVDPGCRIQAGPYSLIVHYG